MSFTSLPFAIFTPLFLLGYFAISAQKRPVLLALASIIFYTWYDPKYLPLLVGSAVIDYVAGRKIYAADHQRDRAVGAAARAVLMRRRRIATYLTQRERG